MPRGMSLNNDATHRVVIRIPWKRSDSGETGEWVECYGPYSKLGVAKGILKKELASARRCRSNPEEVEGWIERSATEWQRVNE